MSSDIKGANGDCCLARTGGVHSGCVRGSGCAVPLSSVEIRVPKKAVLVLSVEEIPSWSAVFVLRGLQARVERPLYGLWCNQSGCGECPMAGRETDFGCRTRSQLAPPTRLVSPRSLARHRALRRSDGPARDFAGVRLDAPCPRCAVRRSFSDSPHLCSLRVRLSEAFALTPPPHYTTT